jgi:predicted nucleotidyltransferase
MIPIVEDNRNTIIELCKEYGVRKLALFGSAATGTFDPATSDLDFVIEFVDYGAGVSSRFIHFADALENHFGRSVDLVFESVLRDPEFRRAVLETQEILFDVDQGGEAAA